MRFNPKWIIGKIVASVDMQKIEHGSSGGGPSYDPIIHFTDGSKIWFTTIEGCDPGNEYGIDIGYTKARRR